VVYATGVNRLASNERRTPVPNPNPTRRVAVTREPDLAPGMTRRPNGLIMYRFTVNGERTTLYGRTVDELLARRYAPLPELERRVTTVDDETTLAAYLELWVDGLALRANSIATHRTNVLTYLVPMFGGELRLAELTPELIRLRFAELRTEPRRRGRPLAPRTVSIVFATLRRALNQAVDDGRLTRNPAARINPNGTTGSGGRAKRVGVELRLPSDADVRAVAAELVDEPMLHDLYVLSVLTGVRQSELLGLGRDAVEGRWLHVTRALRRSDRVVDDPKSAGSARFIPLDPMAAELVARVRARQNVARLAAGERWSNPDELLFTDELGAALAGSTLTHELAKACRRARVRPFRWHDLRHVYASGLLNRGVPIALVSKYLGHANVAITSSVYHHLVAGTDDLEVASTAARVLVG